MEQSKDEQLIAEIERLRDSSRADYKTGYDLAEANRHKNEIFEALFQTFLLFSSEEGAKAVEFLQSRTQFPFVAAHLGYSFTYKGNFVQGIPLLQQAASAGHRFAQYALAIIHYKGDNVPKDVQRAVVMLEELAALEFLPAVYSLGVHLYKPPSEAKGDVKGLNLIRAAARAEYPDAMKPLPALEKSAIMWGVAATSY